MGRTSATVHEPGSIPSKVLRQGLYRVHVKGLLGCKNGVLSMAHMCMKEEYLVVVVHRGFLQFPCSQVVCRYSHVGRDSAV